MSRIVMRRLLMILFINLLVTSVRSDSMSFDQLQWETGRMDEQFVVDSGGTEPTHSLDYFYYYARVPMRMPLLDDSLLSGSAERTYDSAVLQVVVNSNGSVSNDQMRIFARRLTQGWLENGVSWNYFQASTDSLWSLAGGDFNSLSASDTLLIDTSIAIGDSLYFHLDTGFVRLMIEGDNFGWLLMAENIVDRAVFSIVTEDEATASKRPKLIIYFTDGAGAENFLTRRRRHGLYQGGL